MKEKAIQIVRRTLSYIEEHLDQKLSLDIVAGALHYSKFHLHRLFVEATGITIHEYVQRRRLTEAARELLCSERSILEIALDAGYESQQAFSEVFKVMYKKTPAAYREAGVFYPLQYKFHLYGITGEEQLQKEEIRLAEEKDITRWMELLYLTVDGFPCLDEEKCRENLRRYIVEKKAMILCAGEQTVGVMAYAEARKIEFLSVHPQYQRCSVMRLFLKKLSELPGRNERISITTYRAGDRADTGWREDLLSLGFEAGEFLVEYGYPTQRFILPLEQEKTAV